MKRILEIVAKEIRDALPFAIVDNGTWADRSERKRSLLSKLVCYRSVEDALNDGRRVIKIKDGYYQSININTSNDNARIEGSGPHNYGKKGTFIEGSTYGIDIQGHNCHISNLRTTNSLQGGTAPAVRIGSGSVNALRNTLERIHVDGPAGNGVEQEWGSLNTLKYSTIQHAWGSGSPDGYGAWFTAAGASTSNGNLIVGNYFNSNGSPNGHMSAVHTSGSSNSSGNIHSMNTTTGQLYAGITFSNQNDSVQICNQTEDGSYGHLNDVSNGSNRTVMVFGVSRQHSTAAFLNQATAPAVGDNVSF